MAEEFVRQLETEEQAGTGPVIERDEKRKNASAAD